jgi:hypothetical protein
MHRLRKNNIKRQILLLGPVLLLFFFLVAGCEKSDDREKPGISPQNQKSEPSSGTDSTKKSIQGSWKMVYAEIRENDSVQVKDLTSTDFIKIINTTHFAFFNQDRGTSENFMSGAGTYTFDGSEYVETLDFISVPELRGHEFHFEVEILGDSLIQQGHEKVEAANLDRYILEKYIRIKN